MFGKSLLFKWHCLCLFLHYEPFPNPPLQLVPFQNDATTIATPVLILSCWFSSFWSLAWGIPRGGGGGRIGSAKKIGGILPPWKMMKPNIVFFPRLMGPADILTIWTICIPEGWVNSDVLPFPSWEVAVKKMPTRKLRFSDAGLSLCGDFFFSNFFPPSN